MMPNGLAVDEVGKLRDSIKMSTRLGAGKQKNG
jgi:hypothetical protein